MGKSIIKILLAAAIVISLFALYKLRNATTDYNSVVQIADSLKLEREKLDSLNQILTAEIESVKAENDLKGDSLKHYLHLTEILKLKNDSLIAAIANIPDDTIYILMQELSPTNNPLIYPFSGPQVRFYYSAYIENVGNKALVKTQQTALNGCLDYSSGLSKEIELLNVRNTNINQQLLICGDETQLYKETAQNLNNDLANVKKRGKFLTIASSVGSFLFGVIVAK